MHGLHKNINDCSLLYTSAEANLHYVHLQWVNQSTEISKLLAYLGSQSISDYCKLFGLVITTCNYHMDHKLVSVYF